MRTEIYGSFGPACRDKETLRNMLQMGMTGMRLNLSHSMLEEAEEELINYREVAKEAGQEAQILMDMQGPELRIGEVKSPIFLEENQSICLGEEIALPKVILEEAKEGDELLLDDGKILARVLEHKVESLSLQIIRGGILKGHKSVKLSRENGTLDYRALPLLTEKDIKNIKQAKRYGISAIMQPFVTCGQELVELRQLLKKHGAEFLRIFAKIENRQGVEHLEEIMDKADVIVIARGDLGNDMPLWELPRVQKRIEQLCKEKQKPYIVVTQMLASMEQAMVPTRAEVSDIFHAVYHGAYGVMLTGETAVGKYPVEAVKYMANTAKEAEQFKEERFV